MDESVVESGLDVTDTEHVVLTSVSNRSGWSEVGYLLFLHFGRLSLLSWL